MKTYIKLYFNQEARAKPLEHIIFILDSTVSQNIDLFFWNISFAFWKIWAILGDFLRSRYWKMMKVQDRKKYTILSRKCIKELRSVFLFNAVWPVLHLSQAKPLITRSCFWTLLLFFLDYVLLSVVCEKLCPLFGSCIRLRQKGRYLVCAGSGPPLRSPWGLICWAPSSS